MNVEKEVFDKVVEFVIKNNLKTEDDLVYSDTINDDAYDLVVELFYLVYPKLPASFTHGN